MRIYVGDRARGKTFLVAEWFGQNPTERAVVVPDVRQRELMIRDVVRRWPEMSGRERAWVGNIVTWDRVHTHLLGRNVLEVFIDNFDMILANMFRGAQVHATLTYPPEVIQL